MQQASRKIPSCINPTQGTLTIHLASRIACVSATFALPAGLAAATEQLPVVGDSQAQSEAQMLLDACQAALVDTWALPLALILEDVNCLAGASTQPWYPITSATCCVGQPTGMRLRALIWSRMMFMISDVSYVVRYIPLCSQARVFNEPHLAPGTPGNLHSFIHLCAAFATICPCIPCRNATGFRARANAVCDAAYYTHHSSGPSSSVICRSFLVAGNASCDVHNS